MHGAAKSGIVVLILSCVVCENFLKLHGGGCSLVIDIIILLCCNELSWTDYTVYIIASP